MDAVAPPVEWVPGKSRLGWYAGFLLAFLGAYFLAFLGLQAGLHWGGVDHQSANLTLVLQLASIGVASGPAVLYASRIPLPVSGFWVSPRGLTLDYGLRTPQFPWNRVLVRGTRLETTSQWFGVRTVYSLTPYQASRIASVRPTG